MSGTHSTIIWLMFFFLKGHLSKKKFYGKILCYKYKWENRIIYEK